MQEGKKFYLKISNTVFIRLLAKINCKPHDMLLKKLK